MEFIDLHAQYLQLKDEINANIQKVLDHGKYIMGPEVFELEDQLADYGTLKQVMQFLYLLLPLCLLQKWLACKEQHQYLQILILKPLI